MKPIIFFLAFTFSFIGCKEQTKSTLNIEKVYLNPNDTTKNYYTVFQPSNASLNGFLFLIPGFGETAESVMQQTDLIEQLVTNGILTIVPTFQDGNLSLGIDRLSQQTLDEMFQDVVSKYDLENQKFYIGGFSIGGSCSIKYAQNSAVKPVAVFAIDPPLDFERYYNSAKRKIRLSENRQANQEEEYMMDRLEKETGGNPQTHLAEYYALSPYSFSDEQQTAVKKLVNVPLRIYSEPDIDWWMNERGIDFSGMNITDCAAMINELKRLGNDDAVLITTQNKGYRKTGNTKHPHSWSIVDNEELIDWLKSL